MERKPRSRTRHLAIRRTFTASATTSIPIYIDGIVSALYEYDTVCRHMYPDVPVAYGGIPIDLNALPRRTGGSDDDKRALLLTYAAHRGREGEKEPTYSCAQPAK